MAFLKSLMEGEMDLEEAATDFANEFYDSETESDQWEEIVSAFKSGAEYMRTKFEGLG